MEQSNLSSGEHTPSRSGEHTPSRSGMDRDGVVDTKPVDCESSFVVGDVNSSNATEALNSERSDDYVDSACGVIAVSQDTSLMRDMTSIADEDDPGRTRPVSREVICEDVESTLEGPTATVLSHDTGSGDSQPDDSCCPGDTPPSHTLPTDVIHPDCAMQTIHTETADRSTLSESDIGVAEIRESDIDVAEITERDIGVAEITERDIGVAEITPESDIGIAETTPESDIDVAETTPESDIDATEKTPESDIGAVEIKPESDIDAAEITSESDIGMAEITPESDIGAAELKPESDIDVAEITPESDIDVAEITPESDIDVAEITPESDIDAAEITPESDIGAAEIKPESDIDVAEITPGSDIDAAEITPESDIGVTEITPESDIDVAEITPESDIDAVEITPESDIDVAEITPETDIGVAEITPESDIDVAEITPESDIDVAEITPESDIDVAEITPESDIDVAEITPESDIDVAEITPESDIDVAEITPESDIGVAEITPESDICVAEITPKSDIGIAETTPKSDIDAAEKTSESDIGAAEIKPESDIDAAEITPESDIDAAEITPESEIDVAEITQESDIGVAEITPESDICVAEITPESDIGVAEITPKSDFGVAEITPKSDFGVAEITQESDIGVAEITPERDIDATEITPESDIDATEITPESDIDAAEITPESDIGVEEIIPESDIDVAEITPKSDIDAAEITPESDIGVPEVTPKSDIGVAEIRPESDIGVAELTPESDIGVAEITPENDIGVAEITQKSDIGVAEITPESDIGAAEITLESNIGVAELTPESDIGVAELTPESDIGVPEVTPKSDIGVAEIRPESDIGVAETTPESDICVAETATPKSDIGVTETATPECDTCVEKTTPTDARERSQTGNDTMLTQDVSLEANDHLLDEDESGSCSEYPATTASSDTALSQGAAEDYTDQMDIGHQHSGPRNDISEDDVTPPTDGGFIDTEGAFNDSHNTDMSESVLYKEMRSSFSDVFSEELTEGSVTTTDGDTIKTHEREKEQCQEEEEESIHLAASVIVVDGQKTEHEENNVNYEGAESGSKESITQEEITDAGGAVVGRSQSKYIRHFRSSDSHSTSSSMTRTSSDGSRPMNSDHRYTCEEFSGSQTGDQCSDDKHKHSHDKHCDDELCEAAFGEVIVLSDISEDDEYDVAPSRDFEMVPEGDSLRDGRKKGRHGRNTQEEAIRDRDHCTAGRVKSVACREQPEGRAGMSSGHTSTDDEGIFSQQGDDRAAGDGIYLNIHPQQWGESVAKLGPAGSSSNYSSNCGDCNNLVRQQPYDKLGAGLKLCLPGLTNIEGGMAEGGSRVMEGESRVKEGESMVMEGESRVMEGESRMNEGESRVMEGGNMMSDRESKTVDGESSMTEGESRVMEGESGMAEDGLSSSQPDGQERLQELVDVAGQSHTGQHAASDNLTYPLLPDGGDSNESETASDTVEVCIESTCDSSDSSSTEMISVTHRQLPAVDGDSFGKVCQSDDENKETIVTNSCSSMSRVVETMTGCDNCQTYGVDEEDIDIPGQKQQDIIQEDVAGLNSELAPLGLGDDLKQVEGQPQSTVDIAQDDSPDKVIGDTLGDEAEECQHSPVDSSEIDTCDISDNASVVMVVDSDGMHYDNTGVGQLNPCDTVVIEPVSDMMQNAGDGEVEENRVEHCVAECDHPYPERGSTSRDNSDSESEEAGTCSCPVDEHKSNKDTETITSGELSSGEMNEPVFVRGRKGMSLGDVSHFGEFDGFVGKPDRGCVKTENSTSGASRRVSRRDVHNAMRTLKQVSVVFILRLLAQSVTVLCIQLI